MWSSSSFVLCSTFVVFFFQAEDGIRDDLVTGVQTYALPILNLSNELCRDSWTGGSRPVEDALEDVLRVPGGIWRGAEHTHMSGLSWSAGRFAGNESRSVAHDGADRTDARLRHCANLEVRPEKLFLSGYAEELSDLAIRHAALRKRPGAVARPGVSERCAEKYCHAGQGSAPRPHSSRGGCGQEFPF